MFKIEPIYNGHETRATLFVKQHQFGQELWIPVYDVPAGDPRDMLAARKRLIQEVSAAITKARWA